jgi:hypothetical protein
MAVELIYDSSCPNVDASRERLLLAFMSAGMAPRWTEWERSDPEAPPYVRRWGSPTILIDGRDLEGAPVQEGAAACRIYPGSCGGVQGIPATERIAAALRSDRSPASWTEKFKIGFVIAPGIGLALVPKLVCPLCWPLYTSVLGTIGLGFVNYTPYLYPATLVFLLVAIAAVAGLSPAGGRSLPVLAAVSAGAAVLAGKFFLHNNWLLYSGILMFLGAAAACMVRRSKAGASCDRCR